MPTEHLEASVRHRPSAAVIDLHGEINSFGEEVLNAAYTEAEARDPGAIVLNFEGVDYINSTGIALIVSLLARARTSNRRLLAYGLSDHFVGIFNVTRLSDFIGVHPDEESAMSEAYVF